MKEKIMTNEEQIQRIRDHQNCDRVHPLTCRHGHAHRNLEPVERDGKVILICLDCDYVQGWVPGIVVKSKPYTEDNWFCSDCWTKEKCVVWNRENKDKDKGNSEMHTTEWRSANPSKLTTSENKDKVETKEPSKVYAELKGVDKELFKANALLAHEKKMHRSLKKTIEMALGDFVESEDYMVENSLKRLVLELNDMKEMLNRLEWSGRFELVDGGMASCCPVCDAPESPAGHYENCSLDTIIKRNR